MRRIVDRSVGRGLVAVVTAVAVLSGSVSDAAAAFAAPSVAARWPASNDAMARSAAPDGFAPNAGTDARAVSLRRLSGDPASAPRLFVLLNDIHSFAPAQRRAADFLVSLLLRDPSTVLALEGAAGPLDPRPFRTDRADVNAETAAFLLNAGYIGGAEAAALRAPRPPAMIGLEDAPLYRANVAALRAALAARPALKADLARLRADLESRKRATFGPALRRWDDAFTQATQDPASLRARVALLASVLPLADRYPDLAALASLFEGERREPAAEIAREAASCARALNDRPALERAGETALLDDLLDRAQAAGLSLARWPALAARADRRRRAADIDWGRAADAIASAAFDARRRLARTEAERSLITDDEALSLSASLADLSLSAEAARRYRDRRAVVHALLARAGADGERLAPFERFYDVADRRTAVMAARALGVHARVVVLVTGGYHVRDLAARLGAGGAVLSALPLTDAAAWTGPDRHFDVFRRPETPLELALAARETMLARSPRMAPLFGADVLRPLASLAAEAARGALDTGTGRASEGDVSAVAWTAEAAEPAVSGRELERGDGRRVHFKFGASRSRVRGRSPAALLAAAVLPVLGACVRVGGRGLSNVAASARGVVSVSVRALARRRSAPPSPAASALIAFLDGDASASVARLFRRGHGGALILAERADAGWIVDATELVRRLGRRGPRAARRIGAAMEALRAAVDWPATGEEGSHAERLRQDGYALLALIGPGGALLAFAESVAAGNQRRHLTAFASLVPGRGHGRFLLETWLRRGAGADLPLAEWVARGLSPGFYLTALSDFVYEFSNDAFEVRPLEPLSEERRALQDRERRYWSRRGEAVARLLAARPADWLFSIVRKRIPFHLDADGTIRRGRTGEPVEDPGVLEAILRYHNDVRITDARTGSLLFDARLHRFLDEALPRVLLEHAEYADAETVVVDLHALLDALPRDAADRWREALIGEVARIGHDAFQSRDSVFAEQGEWAGRLCNPYVRPLLVLDHAGHARGVGILARDDQTRWRLYCVAVREPRRGDGARLLEGAVHRVQRETAEGPQIIEGEAEGFSTLFYLRVLGDLGIPYRRRGRHFEARVDGAADFRRKNGDDLATIDRLERRRRRVEAALAGAPDGSYLFAVGSHRFDVEKSGGSWLFSDEMDALWTAPDRMPGWYEREFVAMLALEDDVALWDSSGRRAIVPAAVDEEGAAWLPFEDAARGGSPRTGRSRPSAADDVKPPLSIMRREIRAAIRAGDASLAERLARDTWKRIRRRLSEQDPVQLAGFLRHWVRLEEAAGRVHSATLHRLTQALRLNGASDRLWPLLSFVVHFHGVKGADFDWLLNQRDRFGSQAGYWFTVAASAATAAERERALPILEAEAAGSLGLALYPALARLHLALAKDTGLRTHFTRALYHLRSQWISPSITLEAAALQPIFQPSGEDFGERRPPVFVLRRDGVDWLLSAGKWRHIADHHLRPEPRAHEVTSWFPPTLSAQQIQRLIQVAVQNGDIVSGQMRPGEEGLVLAWYAAPAVLRRHRLPALDVPRVEIRAAVSADGRRAVISTAFPTGTPSYESGVYREAPRSWIAEIGTPGGERITVRWGTENWGLSRYLRERPDLRPEAAERRLRALLRRARRQNAQFHSAPGDAARNIFDADDGTRVVVDAQTNDFLFVTNVDDAGRRPTAPRQGGRRRKARAGRRGGRGGVMEWLAAALPASLARRYPVRTAWWLEAALSAAVGAVALSAVAATGAWPAGVSASVFFHAAWSAFVALHLPDATRLLAAGERPADAFAPLAWPALLAAANDLLASAVWSAAPGGAAGAALRFALLVAVALASHAALNMAIDRSAARATEAVAVSGLSGRDAVLSHLHRNAADDPSRDWDALFETPDVAALGVPGAPVPARLVLVHIEGDAEWRGFERLVGTTAADPARRNIVAIAAPGWAQRAARLAAARPDVGVVTATPAGAPTYERYLARAAASRPSLAVAARGARGAWTGVDVVILSARRPAVRLSDALRAVARWIPIEAAPLPAPSWSPRRRVNAAA